MLFLEQPPPLVFLAQIRQTAVRGEACARTHVQRSSSGGVCYGSRGWVQLRRERERKRGERTETTMEGITPN